LEDGSFFLRPRSSVHGVYFLTGFSSPRGGLSW
jgi:hypothetical protein